MTMTNYASAINDGLHTAMAIDPKVLCYGLGVTDPRAVFGTTKGLEETFGSSRVFDTPTSENAMTGIGIGAAIGGYRPVMTHQRLDFFLLALDQLVNAAAKWHYMFGSQQSIPITIRLIIGRGWGQGPTHSQNLQAWFSHIPGLKVVMPTFPGDAKGLLLSSIFDPNPVVFLEHRWLHNVTGEVPDGDHRVPIGKAYLRETGDDLTIVTSSYLTIEALKATEHLRARGINCDLIDLQTVRPLDWETIFDSVAKTGRILCLDSGYTTGSIAGEIVARVTTEHFSKLKAAPSRIAMPDIHEGTSPALTRNFYVRAEDIYRRVVEMLSGETPAIPNELLEPTPHDVPGDWFTGPF
jgi:acetoin:2,6-dichlorophenolindophenol oxidoreductase subunit beta